jgi:hypothetical protein
MPTTYQVVILTARHSISGEMQLQDQRLSDFLNDLRSDTVCAIASSHPTSTRAPSFRIIGLWSRSWLFTNLNVFSRPESHIQYEFTFSLNLGVSRRTSLFRTQTWVLQPLDQPTQMLSVDDISHTRDAKRKSVLVSAPTGHSSMTFIEYSLSSWVPGNVVNTT